MPFDASPSPQAAEAIPVGHVLAALSYALDLTEGQPAGHCLRVCWIGVHVGRALGLDDDAIADLYYALLLKDVGCSSNAARIAKLFLSDDLRFKHDAKLLHDGAGPALRFILGHTAGGRGMLARLRATIRVARDADAITHDLFQTRCERGGQIAQQLRFAPPVSDAVRALDEHWDGGGQPLGLRGQAIPLFSRIALLAQVADVFATAAGPLAAGDEIRRRAGTWFDPEVATAFHAVAAAPGFWQGLAAPDLEAAVLRLEPAQRRLTADESYLDDIALAFAQVVDAKSPFTGGHSERVADFSGMIADGLGFDAVSVRRLRRAALLHDIGKLGVSSAILDKPGNLDDAEWRAMRSHPTHSERILSRIGAFGELARIGGAHHERLDGKGYPRGLEGDSIDRATRIVTTADVCDALTADRPYRAAMPVERMLGIIGRDVGTAFDPACFDSLTTLTSRQDITAKS